MNKKNEKFPLSRRKLGVTLIDPRILYLYFIAMKVVGYCYVMRTNGLEKRGKNKESARAFLCWGNQNEKCHFV